MTACSGFPGVHFLAQRVHTLQGFARVFGPRWWAGDVRCQSSEPEGSMLGEDRTGTSGQLWSKMETYCPPNPRVAQHPYAPAAPWRSERVIAAQQNPVASRLGVDASTWKEWGEIVQKKN